MSFLFDDMAIGGQQTVGVGMPISLGLGDAKIRGSSFVEGPQLVGSAAAWPFVGATLMVAPLANSDSKTPAIPGALCGGINNPYSLGVLGPTALMGPVDTNANVQVGQNLFAQGHVISNCGGHVLAAKKDFDIQHPTLEGWRLRHVAPEAPTADVYVRGKVKNTTEIELPNYWKGLVDLESITVSLTPIGAHQDVIVKRIDEDKVYLQARGGMPINCFYHIFGERKDCEKNIPEYQGTSPEHYPGDNTEYLQSGKS
jgi:hypothetical protein